MEKYDIQLGEEFNMGFKSDEGEWYKLNYKLIKMGNMILFIDPNNEMEQITPMAKILNGCEFKIEKPRHIPEEGERYYYYVISYEKERATLMTTLYHEREAIINILIGNYYNTSCQAEEFHSYWEHVFKDIPQFKEVKK